MIRTLAILLLLGLAPVAGQAKHPWFPDPPPPTTAQIPSPVPHIDGDKVLYATASGAMWGGLAWDLSTTQRRIDAGGFREGNPILATRDGNVSYPVAIGLTAAGQLLTYKLLYKRGHPKLASAVLFIVGAIHVGAALHNIHQ